MPRSGEFIDGIFNYCDRWCDRCRFTARCRVSSTLAKKRAAGLDTAECVRTSFAEARRLLARLAAEYGVDLQAVPSAEDASQEAAARELTDTHPLTGAAHAYLSMCTGRLASLNVPASFRPLQVIEWFQTMIAAKVARAVSGSFLDEGPEELQRRDADGSAKVALLGIDESLAAWVDVARAVPAHVNAILPVVDHLERLRGDLEAAFPGARSFVRPGLDEPGEGEVPGPATSSPSS